MTLTVNAVARYGLHGQVAEIARYTEHEEIEMKEGEVALNARARVLRRDATADYEFTEVEVEVVVSGEVPPDAIDDIAAVVRERTLDHAVALRTAAKEALK